MKKIIISISLLVSFVFGYGQPEINRSSINNTVRDQHLYAVLSFRTPVFADTTAANAAIPTLDSVGKMIFTRDVMAHWSRVGYPKKWVRIGTVTSVISSQSILVSGDGSPPDPYIPSLIVSGVNNNAVVINPDGVFVPTQVQNGLISGGILTWVAGYTYDVSPAEYGIANVVYNTLQDQITFAAADTLPRIDEAAVDINEDVAVIQGAPSELPTQEPSYDPATQVPLAFVTIDSNSTAPPDIREEYIYRNNIEWTTSTSNVGRINPNATNNPYSATKDIDFLLSDNNDSIGFKAPTTPIWSDFTVITLKIFANVTWGANTSIKLQWYQGTTAVGNPVFIANNVYGFISSNTAVYQTVTIRLSDFSNIGSANDLRISVQAFGGQKLDADIDDIRLLGGDGVIIPQVGDDWHVGGNILASTGRLGSLTPNNVDVITGNTVKATFNNTSSQFELFGNQWFRNSNPGYSFLTGTFAISDYYTQRQSNVLVTNTPGSYALKFTGNSFYTFDKSNGHIWNDSLGTNKMKLAPTGALRLYNYGVNAFTGTATKWLAVDVNGNVIEQAPPASAITADNGITMSPATNAKWGGNLTQSATTITGGAGERIQFTGASAIGSFFTVDNTAAAGFAIDGRSTSSVGVYGQSASGYGIVGYATTGTGSQIISDSGLPLEVYKNTSATNSIQRIATFATQSTGTPAIGLGAYIEMQVHTNGSAGPIQSNQIISKWTNATQATRTSEYSITGVNSAVSATLFTLAGSGRTTLNKYGVGSFTAGTPAYGLAVDASGNIIESPVGGGISGITADNGITANTITNVRWGGTLIQATTINTGTSHQITFSGTDAGGSILLVSNTNLTAIEASSAGAGYGVNGTSSSSYGVYGVSTTGIGLYGWTTNSTTAGYFEANASSTNTVNPVVKIDRTTSGTAASGIGSSIDFIVEQSNGAHNAISNQLISKWTTATAASRVSEFSIAGVDNAVTSTLLTISGSGSTRLNKYGVNTFAGVAATIAGFDVNGNIVEVAAAGAGMANPFTTGGQIIYSVGTTPIPLNIGTAGQVLVVNAGATAPQWQTLAGGGSVQDFSIVTANGFSGSVANSTTLPALTITTTVTGLLKGNGTAISAASAGTDYVIPAGNVATATALATPRTINGVSFDGTANITVTAAAGTLTGATLASNVLTTSITSTGALASGSLNSGFTIGDVTMNVAGTDATGDMYYRNASGVLVRLPIGSAGQIISSVGGIPTYVTPGGGSGTLTNFSFVNLNGFTGSVTNPTTTPALTIGTSANGLMQGNGTAVSAITNSSTVGQVLRVTGVSSYAWGALDVANSSAVAGILSSANGGSGNGNPYANGVLLIGNGTSLTKATLTPGTGILISNTSGAVTVSSDYARAWITVVESGATINWNTTTGANARVILNGTGRTLNIQNPIDGYTYTLKVIQGAGGLRTITTWTNVKWPNGGTLPDLSDAVNQYDIFQFKYELSTGFFYGSVGLNYN